MSRFLVLIYGDDEKWSQRTEAEREQVDAAHRAFQAAGSILASGELDDPAQARTIRSVSGGRPVVTDGPFAEFKEVLGGYYEIEAVDIDAAVERAAGLYENREEHAWVEVRPLVAH
ncbi:MAG: YciI family protein [Nocardiaceae bacterium]|nr:YciI family protein [Microbacteriaceae bacterium]MCL2535804.1 YciI family protein [Nocardiaceae bacterium]